MSSEIIGTATIFAHREHDGQKCFVQHLGLRVKEESRARVVVRQAAVVITSSGSRAVRWKG